jgi:hypothetical protein
MNLATQLKNNILATQGQQLWDIRDVKKGIYFYILKTGNQSKSGKLVIN